MTTEILGRSQCIESVPIGFKSLVVKFKDEQRVLMVGSFCIIKCGDVLMKIRIKNIK